MDISQGKSCTSRHKQKIRPAPRTLNEPRLYFYPKNLSVWRHCLGFWGKLRIYHLAFMVLQNQIRTGIQTQFDTGAKSQQHPDTVVGMVCHVGCVHNNLTMLVFNYHVVGKLLVPSNSFSTPFHTCSRCYGYNKLRPHAPSKPLNSSVGPRSQTYVLIKRDSKRSKLACLATILNMFNFARVVQPCGW